MLALDPGDGLGGQGEGVVELEGDPGGDRTVDRWSCGIVSDRFGGSWGRGFF